MEHSNPMMIENPQPPICRPKKPVHQMTAFERAHFVLDLWPYIIPLFVVYAAEYSLQAGTWTAIGFPVESKVARDSFYEYGNWMYHAGSFLSRSSGSLGTVSMFTLWLMPLLQVVNVLFFTVVAANHFWYNYGLLIPCFYAGLLGGAVYVHGYKRICADFGIVDRREFALAATSVAESFGIVCADVMGLFIQACLYQINGIEGAAVSCPVRTR
jgi:battenin